MKLVPALFRSANVLEIAAGRNLVRRSGASPPKAKSSLAFESPAAEQNCQILGMLQFIQVLIIRLFVIKNSN